MENVTQLYWSKDKYKNGEDVPETLLDESEYIDRIVPACNPENTCEVIQDFLEDVNIKDYKEEPDGALKEFLNEETDELKIIKNKFDIAFKDKARMTIIRDYSNQQLIDAQKDLDAVNATIEELNVTYLNLKTT
jgi:F0F1-type ATP synthase gamma subunit